MFFFPESDYEATMSSWVAENHKLETDGSCYVRSNKFFFVVTANSDFLKWILDPFQD